MKEAEGVKKVGEVEQMKKAKKVNEVNCDNQCFPNYTKSRTASIINYIPI